MLVDTVVGNNSLLTHGDLGALGVGQGDSLFHVSLSTLICCAIWWVMKPVLQMEQHPYAIVPTSKATSRPIEIGPISEMISRFK
jgi:hypothetical protein